MTNATDMTGHNSESVGGLVLEEFWITCAVEEGYEVSNLGRIRTTKKRLRLASKTIISQRRKNNGYLSCKLNGRHHLSHRVICSSFYGVRSFPAYEVGHLNGIRVDNAISNLRWVSRKENASARVSHGTAPIGSKNPFSKLSDEQVSAMRRMAKQGLMTMKIANYFSISPGHVRKIVRRSAWGHLS